MRPRPVLDGVYAPSPRFGQLCARRQNKEHSPKTLEYNAGLRGRHSPYPPLLDMKPGRRVMNTGKPTLAAMYQSASYAMQLDGLCVGPLEELVTASQAASFRNQAT